MKLREWVIRKMMEELEASGYVARPIHDMAVTNGVNAVQCERVARLRLAVQ